jgi:membrane peptidoglycan carboxypeptidase
VKARERDNGGNDRQMRDGAMPRLSDESPLENEFRAMFAERSQSVRITTSPYAAVRQRIAAARRKRRIRIGSAGMVFALAATGIGVWATASSGHREVAAPVTPGISGGPTKFVYDDGRTELPAGPLRTAALDYVLGHYGGSLSGLTVETTFDKAVQEAAEASKSPDDVGIAAIDAHTGYVKALQGHWDRPVQIGDLMKPIVLAAGFETGRYTPDTEEPLDAATHPLVFPAGATQPMTYPGPDQKPANWPPEHASTQVQDTVVTLREALEMGANEPMAQVELAPHMDLKAIRDLAVRMGLPQDSRDLLGVPSLVLGVASATPLEMANVYATLADGGVHRDPVLATKLLDANGSAVWTAPATSQQVLSQTTASEVTDVLHSALAAGTTGADPEARTWAFRGAVAMAAGTDGPRSAWFDGYSSSGLVTAVALSRASADGTLVPLADAHSDGPELGSSLAGPIWSAVMKALTR